MIENQKKWGLFAFTLLATTIIFCLDPIPQPQSFHNFADHRYCWGIPNFANVISNLPFLFIGISGLILLLKPSIPKDVFYTYGILFFGVILTSMGSAYYHSMPNNSTLVWDRIPMTMIFMAVLCATITESMNRVLGAQLLLPLVALGVFSVLWWYYTERKGQGDLRLFFLLQFYPMILIPMILVLYRNTVPKVVVQSLGWVVFWYAMAKIFEQLDNPIYRATGISGHTLKHLAAAVSTWYFVVLFRRQYIVK